MSYNFTVVAGGACLMANMRWVGGVQHVACPKLLRQELPSWTVTNVRLFRLATVRGRLGYRGFVDAYIPSRLLAYKYFVAVGCLGCVSLVDGGHFVKRAADGVFWRPRRRLDWRFYCLLPCVYCFIIITYGGHWGERNLICFTTPCRTMGTGVWSWSWDIRHWKWVVLLLQIYFHVVALTGVDLIVDV